jgi:hypothetical protein
LYGSQPFDYLLIPDLTDRIEDKVLGEYLRKRGYAMDDSTGTPLDKNEKMAILLGTLLWIPCVARVILLPTVIVERKCLNGRLYVAENQLFGSMFCATTALSVIYARLGIEKEPLVYGFTNVGKTFDL